MSIAACYSQKLPSLCSRQLFCSYFLLIEHSLLEGGRTPYRLRKLRKLLDLQGSLPAF